MTRRSFDQRHKLVLQLGGPAPCGVGLEHSGVAVCDEFTVRRLEVGDPGDQLRLVRPLDLRTELQAQTLFEGGLLAR